MQLTLSYYANIPSMDVSRFDPSARRNLTTARCSMTVQSESAASMFAQSALQPDWQWECWAMHVETWQSRITTSCNRLAAIAGGTRLIRKFPLLFELPSYVKLRHVSVLVHHPQGGKAAKSTTNRHWRPTVCMVPQSLIPYVGNICIL
jgi:hypothetical protein